MNLVLNNGLNMPSVGFGTNLKKGPDVCKTIVSEALSIGYRLIDTANGYKNDEIIGDVIQNLDQMNLKREDIFITTKYGRGKCRTNVLESIEKLKTTYLDLVLIHWPGVFGLDGKDPKNSELRRGIYEDLEDLYAEGLVKSIGVSNYTIKHIEELLKHCKVLPSVNQVEFHPLLYQKELLEYCRQKGIIVQGYGIFGTIKGCEILSKNETLIEMSEKYKKTVPQILLKWSLQHNVCVIPMTTRVVNLKSNFESLDFVITSEDMSRIDSLNTNTRFYSDPNVVE